MLAILAAVMLAATPQHDTVFLADGGRVVGTVVEEGAQGIAVQLADGSFRRFARREVSRIEYADGSVSTLNAAAEAPPSGGAQAPSATPPPPGETPAPSTTPPPPPSYTPPPPPGYAPRYGPPPYPPPRPMWAQPRTGAPVSPVFFTFGLAAAVPTGQAERGVSLDNVIDPQFDFAFEGGVRVTPHVAVALYGGIGVGDPARDIRNQCNNAGFFCDATSTRFGLMARYTFNPNARMTPWASAGTGWENTSVTESDTGFEQFHYSGWEVLRLQGGVDFRSTPVFGWGLYAGFALGRFSRFEGFDANGVPISDDLSDRRNHYTFTGGLRFTLFP